jgi:hypothetical protein
MKRFVVKHATNGMHHLHLDDSNSETFQKIASAPNVKIIGTGKYALLYDNNGNNGKLFGIMDNEMFEVSFDKKPIYGFIGDNLIFIRDEQWHTMSFDKGVFKEVVLGRSFDVQLSFAMKARLEKIRWCCFLKKNSDGLIDLSFFVDDMPILAGSYTSVKSGSVDQLVARGRDGYYDVYVPNCKQPMDNHRGNAFEELGGVFIWNEALKKWNFHPECTLIADNAVWKKDVGYNGSLYRICDDQIVFVAKGEGKWVNNFKGIRIGGVIYTVKSNPDIVDFDNPKPVWWKKFKDFFNKKSNL